MGATRDEVETRAAIRAANVALQRSAKILEWRALREIHPDDITGVQGSRLAALERTLWPEKKAGHE